MTIFQPYPDLGVTFSEAGARVRVVSRHANSMELCLIDERGEVTAQLPMHCESEVWEARTDALHPGDRYALRTSGPDGPRNAFDSERLLLDPYARHIDNIGTARRPIWCGVATDPAAGLPEWRAPKPCTPREDLVIYEAHVKGLTKLAPFVPEEIRGSYAALGHEAVIAHLVELGVNAVELLPIHAIATEKFLRLQDMTNYWGYSSVGFFAPHLGYASPAALAAGPDAVVAELRGAVDALHAAGISVLLDVVYNHSAEQQPAKGSTSSFRGLDNALYYRFDGQDEYLDVTGCGNALNTAEDAVRQLVLDSLAYWTEHFGIDGFRFDLAATLGRDGNTVFDPHHPLLEDMQRDPRLAGLHLIAEPWDIGSGGWQTGHFATGWSEWNDHFRDRARQFWIRDLAHARQNGDPGNGPAELATALAGSSDVFKDERGPIASVNFVTAHDGFTLRDLVSYNVKHNLLNAELGRDGTTNNRSFNFGVEGPSNDDVIERDRRLAMRNLLGTLCLSAGVPMVCAGDEFGRSQRGNNNPYNQDSPLTWIDWERDEHQLAQQAHLARLLDIRAKYRTLRPRSFNHGTELEEGSTRIEWFDALGNTMQAELWGSPTGRCVQYLASSLVPDASGDGSLVREDLLIVLHGLEEEALLRPPAVDGIFGYELLWDSSLEHPHDLAENGRMHCVLPESTHRIEGPSIRVYLAHHQDRD